MAEASDLTLQTTEGYVNIRANLILIHPQRGILFYTHLSREGELTLFGGRVKFGEKLRDACNRELQEELGLQLELQQTWWDDNIFINTIARNYENCTFHEFSGYGVYYLPEEYDIDMLELGNALYLCEWIRIDDLQDENYIFFPKQLRQTLITKFQNK